MEFAEIQHAIEALPADERAALLTWLSEREASEWDAQIECDFSPGGAGMKWLDEIKSRIADGESAPMSKGPPR